MVLLFFLLWIWMSGAITPGVCVSGAVLSAALYAFCYRELDYRPRYDLLALRKLWSLLAYLGYLLLEILKAGLVIMKLTYSRQKELEPRLIWFDTELTGAGAQTVLADSITLTAGTITVFMEKGRFCIHTLDRPLAEGIEHSEFERQLKKLEE